MNIALYSFNRLEVDLVDNLSKKIKSTLKNIDKIYLYTENTLKERLSQRTGLNELLNDYKKEKIDMIVFQSITAIGTDDYIQSLILNKLMKSNIHFYLIDLEMDSESEKAKMFMQTKIFMGKAIRKENMRRSKIANDMLKQLQEGKVKFYTYCRVDNDSHNK